MENETKAEKEPKPLREIYEEVKDQGGFYGPDWRSQQGDETDQALHRRAIERRERALVGGVDSGSGRLREEGQEDPISANVDAPGRPAR